MIKCEICGCAYVGELKKQRYIYYHCSQARGQCPGGKSVREEILDQFFLKSLEAIEIDEEVISWVIKALKELHQDEKHFREEAIKAHQDNYLRIQKRLDGMYIDKLDGNISQSFYDEKTFEWRKDQDDLRQKIRALEDTNRAYVDDGIKILGACRT